MRVYPFKLVSKNGHSDIFQGSQKKTQFDKRMSDHEIRFFAKSIIRSSGGQCDSFVLFEEMASVGVTSAKFQSAIVNDYEIEISKGIARLIEK